MLHTWLTLRQAEEALKNGRLEEALALVNQPGAQGHRRAGEILQEVGQRFLARAELHLRHDDRAAAWKDLLQAEAAGVHTPAGARLRQQLVQCSLAEIRALLEAGDPARAVEVAHQLHGRAVEQAELRVLEDVARGWSLAQEWAARGDFGQAVAALEHLRHLAPEHCRPLAAFHQEVLRRRREFEPLLVQLHEALEQANWREIMQRADQVLAIAPQHAEARRARSRAWRAVEPPTLPVAVAAATPPAKTPVAEEPLRRTLLWIDGVGGYLVCLSDRVSFGQATPDSYVDIPIYADISRLHGYLVRDAEGYMLEAVRPLTVNQKSVQRALLRDGDRVLLSSGCEMCFHQPTPVSATARIELVGGHRLPLALDAVLLMGDTCVLGSGGDAHVPMPDLRRPVILFRRKNGLGVRAAGPLSINGQRCRERAALDAHATVAADDFRLALEPVGGALGKRRR
jgi:hypothetical protein